MKIICDTNVFISLFRALPNTIFELNEIGSENVLITSISVMELYRGMENKKELKSMSTKLSNYNILHFNEVVSQLAITLINDFKLSHNLQIPDAVIGAMSVVYKLPLFTYNTKDFKFIPDIKLYESKKR